MKKLTILSLILSLFSVGLIVSQTPAPTSNKIGGNWILPTPNKPKNSSSIPVIKKINKPTDDTVYCLGTEKKWLWQEPVNIISKREAKKRPFVIRLSNKTKGGKFCRVEILGKNFKPLGQGLSMTVTSFLPDSIIQSNNIFQVANNACRIDITPDHSGKYVLQERLYDVGNQLIGITSYQYSDNYSHVVEHTNGVDGLPIRIGESDIHPEGLLLHVKFDKHGYDSLLYFTSQGKVIQNKDGAWYAQYQNTADSRGRKKQILRSLDANFNPMIDNYGNCGVMTLYDRNNNDSISIYIDTLDQPMKMSSACLDSTYINVSSRRYIYNDKVGKLGAVEHLGLNNEPVENAFGTHKIIFGYDNDGNEILREGRDLHGNLSSIDGTGWAKSTIKWDSLGNVLEYHQYDVENRPFSKDGNSSSYYIEYNPVSHQEISHIRYIYNDTLKKEEVDYARVRSKSEENILFNDKSRKITSFDSLGRVTCIRFFDKEGKLDEETYCALDSFYYVKRSGVNKSVNLQFRPDGTLKGRYEYDSLTNIKNYQEFDERGILTDTYQHRFKSDGKLIGQSDCNRFGVTCRAGGNSGVRYLHANVSRTLDGKFNAFNIIDEFGEPDYLLNSNGEIYSSFGENESRSSRRILRDEHRNIITEDDFQNLRDKLPKLMSIEVIDSIAYQMGLKDNDLILKYGDYFPSLENPMPESDFKKYWAVRSVVDAQDSKDMIVFRIDDAASGKYGLVKIENLQGTPSELGFIPHIRVLTECQRNRIVGSAEKADIMLPDSVTLPQEGHTAVIGFNEMYRTQRNLPYQNTVKDASILVGALDTEYGKGWTRIDEIDNLQEIISLNDENYFPLDTQKYYFTTNGSNIILLESCGLLYLVHLNDKDYRKLSSVYMRADTEIIPATANYQPFDPKLLEGCWCTPDLSPTEPMAFISFEKHGKVKGIVTYLGMVPNEETPEKVGSPVFLFGECLYGNYKTGKRQYVVNKDLEFTTSYECIDILDFNSDDNLEKEQLKEYFTNDFKKYPNWYHKRMRMTTMGDITKSAIIKNVDKNVLLISDKNGNEIKLIKLKGKKAKEIKSRIDDIIVEYMLEEMSD